MSQYHFVEEYERHVASLIAHHTRDEAMHLAVGGDYDIVGDGQVRLLSEIGLSDGMFLIDLGCGSGRTAKFLAERFLNLRYVGVDVVQELLDYARERAPGHFRFLLNTSLSIPAVDDSADFICAFSLFTHLFHEESFCYLAEARRALVPGGKIVFSFLELVEHWKIFQDMVRCARERTPQPHLNMFIERSAIHVWADALEMNIESILPGSQTPFGQAIAVLRKP